MDSYPSLISIKFELKVSEAKLKTKLQSRGNKIISETKAIKEISDLECRIDLMSVIQQDEAGEEKEILAAYLALLNIGEDVEIGSNFVFCVKTANFLKYDYAYYTQKYESWGISVCTSDDLFDPEKKFVVDGEFVIEMKGIIFVRDEGNQFNKPENCLTERLWKDEDECDFTIVVKEENGCKLEIKIHKVVLAVRSPVFQRMFKTDMKEKQEGKVEIVDSDLDTVESAIAFCYDQNIFDESPKWQKLIALHRFADKYDIENLRRKTEFKFVEEISFENICAITNAVIKLNAPELQDFCSRFLLMSSKEEIPIKDIDKLDNGISADLFKKSFSGDYC